MEQKTIVLNDRLKNFVTKHILDIMSISDSKLKEKERTYIGQNIRVLVVDLAKKDEICVIPKSSYYSDDNITEMDEIEEALNEIKAGNKLLKELNVFTSTISAPGCVKIVNKTESGEKGFMVQCLLLNKTADYFGVVQYALDEIVLREKVINGVVEKLEDEAEIGMALEGRTLFMQRYVQKFLTDNGFPPAEFLIELSAQRYEGSESKARIYIEDGRMKSVNVVCMFGEYGYEQRKLQGGNLRTIRKLMEMSRRKAVSILADNSMHIVGLIATDDDKYVKELEKESKSICFNGYMNWSIYIDGKEEVCYKRGKYFVNNSGNADIYDMKVQAFEDEYGSRIESDTMSTIRALVDILKNQKHGTSVILTDDVQEAKRLCESDRGILIDDNKNEQNFGTNGNLFDGEKILGITEIDGALFMNLNGVCMACGIIVDGTAAGTGNPGRGARFNCINSYIEGKKEDGKTYIALIFSEDGGVDIICNLDYIPD